MAGPFDRLFGNTPFDLDRDGKIDPGEAVIIQETLFDEDAGGSSDDDSFAGLGDDFDSDSFDGGDFGSDDF